jgi:hypothetical protein
MSQQEKAEAGATASASVEYRGGLDTNERAEAHGRFECECIGADGRVKWRDTADNIVTTVGKNLALDAFLAGAAYTVVGPFIGLVSSASYGVGPVLADTMASHAGWTEGGVANAPTYTGPRKTAAWNAATAGAKALSAPLAFAITGTGTVKGLFMVYGSGAVSTIDNTAGTLWSAGLFSGGDKPVSNTDTLNVTYSASL